MRSIPGALPSLLHTNPRPVACTYREAVARCAFCGANEKKLDRGEELETHTYAFIHTENPKELVNMKFDLIVGNPPYQLDTGGSGRQAKPIYQHFIQQVKKLQPRFLTMIIPSRWFAGGMGLDEFRESMLNDDRLRSIEDYLCASDVFPGVGLKGGVCYFLWDRDNPGLCRVATHFKDGPVSVAIRSLREEGVDVFIRFNEGLSILKKVVAVEAGSGTSLELPEAKRFIKLVSSIGAFGLDSTFRGKKKKSGNDLHPEKIGNSLLVEPKSLGFIKHLDPDRPLLGVVQEEVAFGGFLRV